MPSYWNWDLDGRRFLATLTDLFDKHEIREIGFEWKMLERE